MPQYMNNSIEDDMAASAMSLDLLSQSGGVKSGQKRPALPEIEDLNSGDSQLFKVKASYVRPQPVPERPSNPIERLI